LGQAANPPADPSAPDSLPAALVEGIIKTCPLYRRGTRPIHAPGIAAEGWFSPTPVASEYTTAAHFAGPKVRVTVRFSNGTGDLGLPDTEPLVRGMAVRFHVEEHPPTDLIAMTLPVFFSRTVPEFQAFLAATTPAPPVKRSLMRRLSSLAHLETPYPKLASEQQFYDYATAHHEAEAAALYLAAKFVPAAYTTCAYHAVHAFTLTGPDGAARSVRFHWEPVEGVKAAPSDARGNFLRDGLADRIRDGRAEFVLRIQVAEQGDDPSDPSRAWPQCRPRIVMGHLRLTGLVADQQHDGELIGFNPTALLPGMELSNDPTLHIRGDVYPYSYALRLAEAKTTPPAHPTSPNV
jgi:catalase